MLVNLRFVDFLQRGVHLVGGCGKQQHTYRGGIEEFSSQHTSFRIRIGVDQIFKALEFIHDNQIWLQLVQTDLGEHNPQFAYDVVAIHSAVAAVLNSLAKRNQLFQIGGFVFAAQLKLLVDTLQHIRKILALGLLVAGNNALFILIPIPRPGFKSPVAHGNIQLRQPGF